jgi:benzoyl-CoA reductase/2-hydroxyglutaryl-CoA dehydratase subunit BcrC/BadD/HgdB
MPTCPQPAANPFAWFAEMIAHCKTHALAAKAQGHPIVGILCEFAPRELILAAGGLPVCLCGGDPDTIPAAETDLPTNLCPLIKSTYGYLVEHSNPFLEMADLVVAETTCDGKKKMFELMGQHVSTYVLQLPHHADDPNALEFWIGELRKFQRFLEHRYHTTLTRERIVGAIQIMNRERNLRRQLAEMLKTDSPPITGRQLLDLKSILSGIPAALDQFQRILDHLSRMPAPPPPDTEHRARVRVLLTGVPTVHGAERVVDLIEQHGGLIVAQENCTGLKPILEDVQPGGDPIRALAEKYWHLPCSVMSPNHRRFDLLRRLAAEYRAECVIDLIWQACLTYAVESCQVKRLAETDLALPFLRLETDYSPSDTARIVVRLEALFETIRSRRTS